MPNYKGHLVGGVAVYVVLFYIMRQFNPSLLTSIEWAAFTLLGSLFPDIDIKSKGQKIFYWIVLLVFLALLATKHFVALGILSILSLVPMLAKHRGLFHRLWFIIAVPLGIVIYAKTCVPLYAKPIFFDALFFTVGAISHLWLDLGLRRMFR